MEQLYSLFSDSDSEEIEQCVIETAKIKKVSQQKVIEALLKIQKFEIEILYAGTLKDIFESLAKFKKKIILNCSPRGIYVNEIDEKHVSLLELDMSPQYFERYRCAKEVHIKVNAVEISKHLKKVLRRDSVKIQLKDEKLHFLIERYKGGDILKFSVPAMGAVHSALTVPSNEWDTKIKMPSDEFYQIIKKLKNKGTDAIIRASKRNVVNIYSPDESAYFAIENDETHEVDVDSEDKVTLSTHYLFLFAQSKKLAKKITIKITQDFPVLFEFEQDYLIKLRYHIAPIISE